LGEKGAQAKHQLGMHVVNVAPPGAHADDGRPKGAETKRGMNGGSVLSHESGLFPPFGRVPQIVENDGFSRGKQPIFSKASSFIMFSGIRYSADGSSLKSMAEIIRLPW
jgi:hypothetical protein